MIISFFKYWSIVLFEVSLVVRMKVKLSEQIGILHFVVMCFLIIEWNFVFPLVLLLNINSSLISDISTSI